MQGSRNAVGELDIASPFAFDANLQYAINTSNAALVDTSGVTFTNTFGYDVLVAAFVASYPNWIDENGTNVEQLAAIAVSALQTAGILDHVDDVQPTTR